MKVKMLPVLPNRDREGVGARVISSRLLSKPYLATAVLCLALTGCVVGPKYHPPSAAQSPPAYKEVNVPAHQPAANADTVPDPTLGGLGDWKVANPQDALPRGKWWEIYNNPELNALEEQLNIDNQNIKQFFENFMAARALVRQARSQFFPTATVGFNYSRSRGSPNLGNNIGATGTTSGNGSTGLIDLPFDVSWEPDLWGKVRNTVRQAQYSAQVSAADLENERLTEQAGLATFFFELRGQDALQQILDATVVQDQKALDFNKSQYDLGLTDRISVVQAETTLESAQAQATNLGIARAQFEHAIALLVGKAASEFSIPVKPVLTTPPPIPVGLPSQLLERRPDIAAAERTMAAANAQIGVATAAFYPNLSISASAGFESSIWKKLFDWPSRFWSVGPSLSETVFDAGLRRATVNQFTAVYNADLAAYRQSVLTAFQQVEDSLAAVRILTQQIQQQHQAVESARVALDLETKRYESGIDPYIDVVTEQNALLSSQQILALIEIQRMTQSVSLIEALGGGWDRSELATPQQVTAKPAKADTTIQQP
jgi:NodT family efflux transporter outer membrane factor (OMF) lipoprotein